jgi:hypothetical protein
VSAYPENAPAITDAEAAREVDLEFRTLRARLIVGATQWLFVAGALAIVTSLPKALDALIAVAGVGYPVLLVRHFAAKHARAVAAFADPATGEIRIPGERQPLPERARLRSALVVGCEVAILVFLIVRG